jgi:hypothetical protein
MARTKSTSFQLELIRQQNDKSRTERTSTLNQRIVTLAEQSEYERKRGIRLAIAAQQARRQQIHLIEDELDKQSSDSEEETDNSGSEEETNTSFQTRNFDYIVGIILGFILGFSTQDLQWPYSRSLVSAKPPRTQG